MSDRLTRRKLLKTSIAAGSVLLSGCNLPAKSQKQKTNLVFVFADQWRAQDTGYAGNPDIITPNLDAMAAKSTDFANTVSCCPVCSPFRASLMTGQYPLTHGVFINDLQLNNSAVSIAQAYNDAGYQTAYIGKWHLDGSGRSSFIPQQRRHGFQYWKALECTHDYNDSEYYAGQSEQKQKWPGYDAYAQTDDAISYIRQCSQNAKPFALFLSWGPPHTPFNTAPKKWMDYYNSRRLKLRPNVPELFKQQAQKNLAGYYAHCTALDECIGKVQSALKDTGLDKNTIVIFTSDHGEMLYSQGQVRKQRPWDESVRVPLLIQCPASWNVKPHRTQAMINSPDLMPTMLSLCDIAIPRTAQGHDYSKVVLGKQKQIEQSALIMCASPFGEWKYSNDGREYRGVRTSRYTYIRSLDGPWLLYDNTKDPYQTENLCGRQDVADVQAELEGQLHYWLKKTGDDFASGPELVKRCGYKVDSGGTVPHANKDYWSQVSKTAAK